MRYDKEESKNYLKYKTLTKLPDDISPEISREKIVSNKLEKARRFINVRRIVAIVLIVLGVLTWFVNQRIQENTGGYDEYHYGEFYNDDVEIPEISDQSPDFSGIQ